MPMLPLRASGVALLACVLAGPTAGPAAAQGAGPERAGPVFPAPTPVADDLPAAPPGAPFAAAHAAGGGAASATFQVTYTGFPAEARAAFQAAVDAWAGHVDSPVPIRIEARWQPLGGNVLGQAGPFLLRNFEGAPLTQTWYPNALADAFAGRDLDPARPDIQANFNSAFTRWHLDPATAPPLDRYDLASVVLHELGHGLGFIGSLDVEGGRGVVGAEDAQGNEDGVPFAYDRRTEDADGRPLLDYPAPSVALAAALVQPTFFDGPVTREAYGDRAPLYSPASWAPGTSFSHLDEGTFPTGSSNALMTPFFAQGERIAAPDALACAVLVEIGWTPGPGCEALLPGVEPPPPPPAVFTLALAPPADGGRNPFRDRTVVVLTAERDQRVRVGLYDATGRLVADLLDEELVGGVPTQVEVSGPLAAGVYFVRADGDGVTEALAVTRER
jgi:hypothetical protein